MPDRPTAVTHDQLLRTMDALMDRAEAVEARIAQQIRPLLDQQLSVVFYDLTTVRIHGEGAVAADVRAFGLNTDTGGIGRKLLMGVVARDGGITMQPPANEGTVTENRTP